MAAPSGVWKEERERSRGGWVPVDFNRLFYITGATPRKPKYANASANGKGVPGLSLPLDRAMMDKAGLFIACEALGWKTKKSSYL